MLSLESSNFNHKFQKIVHSCMCYSSFFFKPSDDDYTRREKNLKWTKRRNKTNIERNSKTKKRKEKKPWKWKAILPTFPRFCIVIFVLVSAVVLFIHLIYEYYDHTRIYLYRYFLLVFSFSFISRFIRFCWFYVQFYT